MDSLRDEIQQKVLLIVILHGEHVVESWDELWDMDPACSKELVPSYAQPKHMKIVERWRGFPSFVHLFHLLHQARVVGRMRRGAAAPTVSV